MRYKLTLNKITGILLSFPFVMAGGVSADGQQAEQIAVQRIAVFRSIHADKLAEYKQLKSSLAEENEIADLLLGLQKTARKNKLTILRFTPKKALPQDFINSKTVEVEVETNFSNLEDFFSEITKLQKIVSIDGFRITQRGLQTTDKTLDAQFLLTVYYGANNSFEGKISPTLKPVEEQKELETRITNLDATIETIKRLRAAQDAPSAVMEALRERIVMSPGLYLETVEQIGEQITIKGNSPDETIVTQFGRSMEFSGGLFSNLNIETQRQKLMRQNKVFEVVNFTVRCQYNPQKAVSTSSK